MDILSFPKLTPKQNQLEKILELDSISQVRGSVLGPLVQGQALLAQQNKAAHQIAGCIFFKAPDFPVGFCL